MKTIRNRLFYTTLLMLSVTILTILQKPIKANAISASPTYATSISVIGFDDHQGMLAKIYVNGQWYYMYCIQRGYPFRSAVSDLQMVLGTTKDYVGNEHYGVLSKNIRDILTSSNGDTREFFRGWGQWTMNGDRTDATQTGTNGAPSSEAWQEVFTEFKEDDEDEPYKNRYINSSDAITSFFVQVKPKLKGHEGAISKYATRMKEITYQEAGLDMSQVYAMAMTNYYVWEDPDTDGYSDKAKYQTKQIFDWLVQFKFVRTIGGSIHLGGSRLTLIYQDSSASWSTGSFSGSCDGFVQYQIGSQYEAMKLYRQVVWKTTNMRAIPSFASLNPNNCEPIKLYWDAEQGVYTATVSDANGVLKYFDFEIPGVTCTDNGDGTLTIKSSNIINGSLTSLQKASKLEPSDGIFKLPSYYRWDLEGKDVTFKYTVLQYDLKYPNDPIGNYHTEETRKEHSEMESGFIFNHSHSYSPACNWFCNKSAAAVTHCNGRINNCSLEQHSHKSSCYYSDCNCNGDYTDDDGNYVGHENSCHKGDLSCNKTVHTHDTSNGKCHNHEYTTGSTQGCYHKDTCPYYKSGHSYCNAKPIVDTNINDGDDTCVVIWACGKEHYKTASKEITGTYIDWQDLSGVYANGQKIIDPTYAYIKVTTVPHTFPAETDTEILLIADNDEWNDLTYTTANGKTIKHSSHLRVGEKFHLKYVYSYQGASKGFKIQYSLDNKPYYQYNYLARMQSPQNTTSIYNLRNGLAGDRFSLSSIAVPNAKLVQDLTNITIKGVYCTPETAYGSGAYSWNSGTSWNDKVYLDALTDDQYDDNYNNKSAKSIKSTSGASELTDFSVTKPQHNKMIAVWEFDTEPEVFTSALVYATGYIDIDKNRNYTQTSYDEAYNYGADKTWSYDLGEHNNVGGVGYFNTGKNGEQISSHTIYTQNNEHRTYAIRNKVWQSDVDIKVSNFVQNTGAGITEHIYQTRGRKNHDMNYNLYYTIDVENPKATIYADKQRAYDGKTDSDKSTTPYNTSSDVYEFDVNNMISWGSTGASSPTTGGSYGNVAVVDHIKTGRTYIQREIPTVLNTMENLPKETMNFRIYPNYDRLIYEDHYTNETVNINGSGVDRKVTVSTKDEYYPSNERTASSDIYSAMNPNIKEMQPRNIVNSNNMPDEYNQSDNALHHIGPTTSFSIKLSNGETKTIVDSHTKTYKQYDFGYNPSNNKNKVTFSERRNSIMFFKYSKTDYGYNGNSVQSAIGEFKEENKTQTESYYINQVLFKSNYTSKYKKELEAKGADYIEDFDANGNLTDAWIDMVNQNKFAIVSAGQGFELKVTVKYENSALTQYLARYLGQDDGQSDILGGSGRVQEKYNEIPANSKQYANISALTGKDGRGIPFYTNSARAYISSYSVIDRLAVNLVTGANVFNDLYCFMSDNPDTVYSYSGIYDTPVIFDRKIKYSSDYSVTTITYTMCVSHSNGISSNLQKMKFFTNQLAPDKKSAGVVEGNYDVTTKGEHSIKIWTPIITATPFDYPNTAQERYLGDAVELGYTIKTTGADDSIVHIVQ